MHRGKEKSLSQVWLLTGEREKKGKKGKKNSPTAFSIKLLVEKTPTSFPEMSVENRAAPGSRERLCLSIPWLPASFEHPCAVGGMTPGGVPTATALLLSKQPSKGQILPHSALAGTVCRCLGDSRAGMGALFLKGNGWDKSQRGKLGPPWPGSKDKISPGMQASGVLLN